MKIHYSLESQLMQHITSLLQCNFYTRIKKQQIWHICMSYFFKSLLQINKKGRKETPNMNLQSHIYLLYINTHRACPENGPALMIA